VSGFVRIAQIIAVNLVPAFGVMGAGWTGATALVLYWFENLISTLLVASRIAIHRRATGKRGHYTTNVTTVVTRGKRSVTRSAGTFGDGYLSTSLVFTLAHGLFIGLLVFAVIPKEFGAAEGVSMSDLGWGMLFTLVLLVLGFFADLGEISQRPFAWVKKIADASLGRMVVVHLTIIFGMFAMMKWSSPSALFAVFVAFKILVDVGISMPQKEYELSEKPPQWVVKLTKLSGSSVNMEEEWIRIRKEEIERKRTEELPVEGFENPSKGAVIADR
jgi:hypothetical protein